MILRFAKWQGAGNDFILVDDRNGQFAAHDEGLVRQLCDRHFGVGSDGLILVKQATMDGVAFHVEFYNPDGSRSFCGNGSRCAFAFWSALQGGADRAAFSAYDGVHHAAWHHGEVALTMRDTLPVCLSGDDPTADKVDTGSPHEIVHVEDLVSTDVRTEGRRRRNAAAHLPGGTNVNFVRVHEGRVHMRTYERGVEDETLSCGTGVVAAALSAIHRGLAVSPVVVETAGGILQVEARSGIDGFADIRLIGPAVEVFSGAIRLDR